MKKLFEFKVTLNGYGDDELEAWENAIIAFSEDPGIPKDSKEKCPDCLNYWGHCKCTFENQPEGLGDKADRLYESKRDDK